MGRPTLTSTRVRFLAGPARADGTGSICLQSCPGWSQTTQAGKSLNSLAGVSPVNRPSRPDPVHSTTNRPYEPFFAYTRSFWKDFKFRIPPSRKPLGNKDLGPLLSGGGQQSEKRDTLVAFGGCSRLFGQQSIVMNVNEEFFALYTPATNAHSLSLNLRR